MEVLIKCPSCNEYIIGAVCVKCGKLCGRHIGATFVHSGGAHVKLFLCTECNAQVQIEQYRERETWPKEVKDKEITYANTY